MYLIGAPVGDCLLYLRGAPIGDCLVYLRGAPVGDRLELWEEPGELLLPVVQCGRRSYH